MTGIKKMSLIVLGTLAAMFMIAQLVMGLLLAGGQVNLRAAHQHTGYTTVVLGLIYIGLSMTWLLRLPSLRREAP